MGGAHSSRSRIIAGPEGVAWRQSPIPRARHGQGVVTLAHRNAFPAFVKAGVTHLKISA